MGFFIGATELKDKCDSVHVKNMDVTELDENLIYPAERRIEELFHLDLDTNMDPTHWIGMFTARPSKRTLFQNDYKRAVIALVTHWAENRFFMRSETLTGASMRAGPTVPPQIYAYMRRWGRYPRVVRI